MENILESVPAAFNQRKHGDRSGKYNVISTDEIMGVFQENNWHPNSASQVRVYKKNAHNRDFAKHLITFRNPDLSKINGLHPQINIINSHNGSSKFNMMAGLYRFICSNGLIVSDSEFESFSIRHIFLNPEVISNAINEIMDVVPRITAKAEVMDSIIMNPVDRIQMADNVLTGIWGKDKSPFQPSQMLEARREEDNEPTIWKTYNVLQENLMKGGIIGRTSTNKKRRMKGITNIDKTVKINKLLWNQADEFLQAA